MRNLLGVPIIAVLLAVAATQTAEARYCGAARYTCCATSCDGGDYVVARQQCHVVMKTCREVVYEKQSYTCYKTVYDRVCEPVRVYAFVRQICRLTTVPTHSSLFLHSSLFHSRLTLPLYN